MEAAQSRQAERADESALLAALRAGDERAFMMLVEEYTPGMRRLALSFVRMDLPHRRECRAHARREGGAQRAVLVVRDR